jgi:hypothetical protein
MNVKHLYKITSPCTKIKGSKSETFVTKARLNSQSSIDVLSVIELYKALHQELSTTDFIREVPISLPVPLTGLVRIWLVNSPLMVAVVIVVKVVIVKSEPLYCQHCCRRKFQNRRQSNSSPRWSDYSLVCAPVKPFDHTTLSLMTNSVWSYIRIQNILARSSYLKIFSGGRWTVWQRPKITRIITTITKQDALWSVNSLGLYNGRTLLLRSKGWFPLLRFLYARTRT